MKKNKPIPEKYIEKQILHYLRSLGWVACKIRTTGRFVGGKMIPLPKDEHGVSDIIACDTNGLFHAIEIKNAVGKQSEYQKLFERKVKASNGKYAVIRSLDEIKEYVAQNNART